MKKVLNSKFVFIISGLIIFCLIGISVFCSILFIPNTVIETSLGAVEVGGKNKDYLCQELKTQIYESDIYIIDNANIRHNLKLSDFYEIDEDKLNGLVKSKSYLNWHFYNQIDISDYIVLSKDKIGEVVNQIKSEDIVKSESAYIYIDEDKKLFDVAPEIYGNEFVNDIVDILETNFSISKNEYNLSELNCYVLPDILKDNTLLQNEVKDKNSFLETEIEFKFGDNIEKVDRNIYFDWITFLVENGKADIDIDLELVNEYVDSIVEKYNTISKNREFVTSTNEIVVLNAGSYGWKLNRDFIYNTIVESIKNKNSIICDFEYEHTAKVLDIDDIGDTYIEVSIDNQKVWMYKDGECIVDTPVVTGCLYQGHSTRKGVFSIYYKSRNTTLRGRNNDGSTYASFVKYWMPFDGGIGMHDASWRSSFGGSIYLYSGSHGCVNMPSNAAEIVYENIDETIPIIVW